MNINLTSSVNNLNSSSTSKGLVAGVDGESLSEQPDSFFDKLSSLLFSGQRQALAPGEDSSADSAVDSATDIDAAIEPNSEQASVENTHENDAKPSVSSIQANASMAAESLSTLSSTEEAAEMDVKPLSHQRSTEQVMHDGEDMLERLHQANQTLSAYHGKSLPQDISLDDDKPLHSLAVGTAIESNYHPDPMAKPIQSDSAMSSSIKDNNKQWTENVIHSNSAIDLSATGTIPLTADRYQSDQSDHMFTVDNDMSSVTEAAEVISPVMSEPVDSLQTMTLASSELMDNSMIQHSGLIDEASLMDPSLVAAGSVSVGGHAAMKASLDDYQSADSADSNAPKKLAASISAALAASSPNLSPPSAGQGTSSLLHASVALDAPEVNEIKLPPLTNRTIGQELTQSPALDNLGLKTALAGSMLLAGKDSSASEQGADDASLAQQLASTAVPPGTNVSSPLRNELTSIQAQPLLVMGHKGVVAEEMSERIQMMMSKNLKNIDIRLDPPELGRMQIRMNMHADSASVQFTVTNHQAREALEGAMPRLREMLAQQGIQLADTSVQQQSSGQQQRYASEHRQSGSHGEDSGFISDDGLDADIKLDVNLTAKRDGISYYA